MLRSMRAIILSTAVFAAACGPVDAEPAAAPPQSEQQLTMKRATTELAPALAGFRQLTPPGTTLFLDRLQVDDDGSLVALAVESANEGCEQSAAGPGCVATAWALRWTGGVWVPFE